MDTQVYCIWITVQKWDLTDTSFLSNTVSMHMTLDSPNTYHRDCSILKRATKEASQAATLLYGKVPKCGRENNFYMLPITNLARKTTLLKLPTAKYWKFSVMIASAWNCNNFLKFLYSCTLYHARQALLGYSQNFKILLKLHKILGMSMV